MGALNSAGSKTVAVEESVGMYSCTALRVGGVSACTFGSAEVGPRILQVWYFHIGSEVTQVFGRSKQHRTLPQ